MVRDPNSIPIALHQKEESRPKRASSLGALIRRLFSKSQSHAERSSSENQASIIDSAESSTLPPNNRFFIPPILKQDRLKGGKEGDYSHSLDRAAMASHRGYDSGQHGGTWRQQVIEIQDSSGVAEAVQPSQPRDVVAI